MKCLNCDSDNWVIDQGRGDYICCDCGAVQDDRILDLQPEHRTFSNNQDDSGKRRAQATDPYFSKLSDTIVVDNHKSGKKKLKTDGLARAHQILTAADPSLALTDHHLEIYFAKIRELTTVLELPGNVEAAAKDLIFRYEKSKGRHRRTLDILSAALAVIDLAGGQLQLGKPLNDLLFDLKIAHWTDLPEERDIWITRRKIVEQLPGVETTVRSEDVIHNFCTTLQVSRSVRKVAIHMHERIKPLVEGKSLNTVAGGCILLACQALNVSMDRDHVVGVSQVAPTTLQNFCKIGNRHWGTIVPTTTELKKLSN